MEQGPSYTAYMTRCSHQAYPEACTYTVRQRLFCVSVYALHWRASPEAAWAYGEDAERYRAGWLCSTDNSCAFCVCVPCPPGRCGRRSGAIGTSLRDMHAGRPASTPRAAAPPPGHPAVVHGRASGGGAGPGPALTPPASPLPSLPGGGSVPAAMPCTAARWRLPRVTGARGGWFMTADTRCVCT